MMLGLGIGISLAAARAPGFDPFGLFASGEIGWVEPMLPGVTLFQDAAGTIPVTAPGQPVGLSKFTAGGQLGFVQATALNRPIYQVDAQGRGYLAHNGVNQWMRTAAFAWGSDKATICAGVRKLSDAPFPPIVEFSSNVLVNNGAFSLRANGSSDTKLLASSIRGTSLYEEVARSPAYGAPISLVLTCVYNIGASSADASITIRANSANVATNVLSGTTQGSGNFGTYPLYAGSRAGTSLFFNGNRYPSMGINRLLTEAELAQVEAWVNQRTGAF